MQVKTGSVQAAEFTEPGSGQGPEGYKGNQLSYYIARKLIKVKYISLVNLIMDKEVVKELIQDELNPENCTRELKKVLEDGPERTRLLEDYNALTTLLSEGGNASDKAARSIVTYLSAN